MVIRQTIRQTLTPDELRGRMSSVNMIFFMGGPQLGRGGSRRVAKLLGVRIAAAMPAEQASLTDRDADAEQLRHHARLPPLQLRPAHEEDHVDRAHPAAQLVGRERLADGLPDHHAHGVRRAREGEHEES